MHNRIKQWFSVMQATEPARVVFYFIFLINLSILLVATGIILLIHLIGGTQTGFFEQMYHTILVMINAGNINDVVDATAEWDAHFVIAAIFYLILVFITMISFTGALVGFLTNKISSYVERANAGLNTISLTNHTVILNWNNRASEIINDMIYKQKRETIIVMVNSGKDQIETEIQDRLQDTIDRENKQLRALSTKMPFWQRRKSTHKKYLRNLLTVIVRSGEMFAVERLMDVSTGQAKSVLILSNEPFAYNDTNCNPSYRQHPSRQEDCSIIKLLIQVAEISAYEDSRPHQRIVVEVNDPLTMSLVAHIINEKRSHANSEIIAVPVDHILGNLLAQVAIMPELNLVYNGIFSYQGAEFFSRQIDEKDPNRFFQAYLPYHTNALALTVMHNNTATIGYYIAAEEEEIDQVCKDDSPPYTALLNDHYVMEHRSVIVIGHNAKLHPLIDGFTAFTTEWQEPNDTPVLDVIIIDDPKALEDADDYSQYTVISKCVKASIYDKATICNEVSDFIHGTDNHISILILADDTGVCGDADKNVFTYLIYIQSAINELCVQYPSFDRNRIDLIVEVCNPQNADIIANYNVNNVIISNRYISRLLNHLSEKEALYYFLADILTYDRMDEMATGSKEIYVKRVKGFFHTMPAPATARQLIRAIYDASPANNRSILIGYITAEHQLTLFSGDQRNYHLQFKPDDYLVLFSNH